MVLVSMFLFTTFTFSRSMELSSGGWYDQATQAALKSFFESMGTPCTNGPEPEGYRPNCGKVIRINDIEMKVKTRTIRLSSFMGRYDGETKDVLDDFYSSADDTYKLEMKAVGSSGWCTGYEPLFTARDQAPIPVYKVEVMSEGPEAQHAEMQPTRLRHQAQQARPVEQEEDQRDDARQSDRKPRRTKHWYCSSIPEGMDPGTQAMIRNFFEEKQQFMAEHGIDEVYHVATPPRTRPSQQRADEVGPDDPAGATECRMS